MSNLIYNLNDFNASQIRENSPIFEMLYDETSRTKVLNESENREMRVRAQEFMASIHSAVALDLENSMLSFTGADPRGNIINLADQVVILATSEYSDIGKLDGKNIDRVCELPLEGSISGLLSGFILHGPTMEVELHGTGSSVSMNATSRKYDFGIVGVQTLSDRISEDFAISTLVKYFANNQQKLEILMQNLERCTVFRTMPQQYVESDNVPLPLLERDFLPTVGQSRLNKTGPLPRQFVNNKQRLSELNSSDIITAEVIEGLSTHAASTFMTPLEMGDATPNFGFLTISKTSKDLVNSFSDPMRDLINNSQTGRGEWMDNPLYKYSFSGQVDGHQNVKFFYNNLLTSSPVILQYTDSKGQLNKLEISKNGDPNEFRRRAQIQKYRGTALAPRARVYGLINGDTDLTAAKVQFVNDKGQSDVLAKLKAGTYASTDYFLLVNNDDASYLDHYSDRPDRDKWAEQGISALKINATESALASCTLPVGHTAGEIQIGETYSVQGTAANEKKWRVIYTGCPRIGTFSKTTNSFTDRISHDGQNVHGAFSALKIHAIYRYDPNNDEFEANPVGDADMAAEIQEIMDNLIIEDDGFISPYKDANLDALAADSHLDKRRTVNYFGSVRNLFFGQSLMVKAIPAITTILSGAESRQHGFFNSEVLFKYIGNALYADRETGEVTGGIEVISHAGPMEF